MLDVTPQKPEWEYNTPVKFWELSLPEQLIYTAAYGAEFQYGLNKNDRVVQVAKNALYSFWRRHGNPRFTLLSPLATFADDDWGQ